MPRASDTGLKAEGAQLYLTAMEDSFFVRDVVGIVVTEALLTMRRSWGVICKYAAVSEHSGLANRTWVWFWKYKRGCVDTSWPPESSMHLARGTYWLSELVF